MAFAPKLSYTLALIASLAKKEGAGKLNLYTKEFVDALSHPDNCTPRRQAEMIADEPMLLEEAWCNALLAGMAEFIAQREDIEVPSWALKPERFLPKPVFWGVTPQMRAHMLAETPGPFRRRNLFCGYVWLRSSRWDSLEKSS